MELSRWAWTVWKSWFKHLAELAKECESLDGEEKIQKLKEIQNKAKGYEESVNKYWY